MRVRRDYLSVMAGSNGGLPSLAKGHININPFSYIFPTVKINPTPRCLHAATKFGLFLAA